MYCTNKADLDDEVVWWTSFTTDSSNAIAPASHCWSTIEHHCSGNEQITTIFRYSTEVLRRCWSAEKVLKRCKVLKPALSPLDLCLLSLLLFCSLINELCRLFEMIDQKNQWGKDLWIHNEYNEEISQKKNNDRWERDGILSQILSQWDIYWLTRERNNNWSIVEENEM